MKKSVLATCFESFQKKMTYENGEKIGSERHDMDCLSGENHL